MMEPYSYAQRDGNVVVEVETDIDGQLGLAEIVVRREDVPALLHAVMTALRVGDYSDDQRDACAKVCKANLSGYMR
jgi:hypothetical protein